jgi:hypothetical protein
MNRISCSSSYRFVTAWAYSVKGVSVGPLLGNNMVREVIHGRCCAPIIMTVNSNAVNIFYFYGTTFFPSHFTFTFLRQKPMFVAVSNLKQNRNNRNRVQKANFQPSTYIRFVLLITVGDWGF